MERASDTYGSLGTAVAMLLWLYLFGRLLMGAVVLNASLAEEGGAPRSPPSGEDGRRGSHEDGARAGKGPEPEEET